MSWADTVIVMEEFQRHELAMRFPDEHMKKRVLSMDIPDVYSYNHPELIEIKNEGIIVTIL